MSLSIDRFTEFFRALYQDKQGRPLDPFPWQQRLAQRVFDGEEGKFPTGWPDCIDLPTASGKTACIDIAVFVLACQAQIENNKRTVGRRIFFTVNRRVIVDEAFDRAKVLAQKLLAPPEGILREVADALHEIGGDSNAPPLDVAELRGGIYRDRAWARSITQPIVVCTTADQLGSRLLFRGYGVSESSAPIHAALCGCDSLVLLDEAHVTRAFSQTLQLIARYQAQHSTAPRMHVVQMTATPAGEPKAPFGLEDADWGHPVLGPRLRTSKPVALVRLGKKKSLVAEIVTRAFDALSDTRKAVGIIVNRVQTARDVERAILARVAERAKKDGACKADVHLIIGRMRPIDRDDLQNSLRSLVGPKRPDIPDRPVFVVATQCLEVGADYDFDALITECASIDALRQRFGRLNRRGRLKPDHTPLEVVAAIVTNEESLKGDDPIYGDAIQHTWEWLTENDRSSIDFGIAEFTRLWEDLDDTRRQAMLAPAPDAAVLLPAHLDALCQTALRPEPSPDVSYFIHGPRRDNAEVSVCWRADLGDDESLWPRIVELLPPSSIECMTVPLRDVQRWMNQRPTKADRDADVPVMAEPDDDRSAPPTEKAGCRVVVWRGASKTRVVATSRDLRPNDTILIPTKYRNWNELGHIPGLADALQQDGESTDDDAQRVLQLGRSIDVAELAARQTRLRVVVRIHPAFGDTASLRGLSDPELRQALVDRRLIPANWANRPVARIERHPYRPPDDDGSDSAPDEVITFKRLLDQPAKLVMPSDDEDDGDDNLTERGRFVLLDDHGKHVADRMAASLDKLHLGGLRAAVRAAPLLHDIGKADVRFQAMLAGITPYEAIERPKLLAKGDGIRRTATETQVILDRSLYPQGFRHEMLSVELAEYLTLEASVPHRELLLHLVAAHHGYARPFAPVCVDKLADEELQSVWCNGHSIPGRVRRGFTPSHRLDSGIAERFWKLTREHGWWGLAWLESILRLADQQASAAEQEGANNE